MIADSLIVPECIFQPGSFTGLMTLYESSYLKLQRLFDGSIDEVRDAVSCVDRDCDLHFSVTGRDRYTTNCRLTYLFEAQSPEELDEEPVADPDLHLKIYHDAKLLEAVSHSEQHRHQKLRELSISHHDELDRRWQRNMLLNKWLDYLLESGHRLI